MEKTKTKKTKKTKKPTKINKKMNGGKEELIQWDEGGTGIKDLPADIIGVIIHTINTVVNTIVVVDQISGLQSNMGTAFSSPTEPNPDDIDITGM